MISFLTLIFEKTSEDIFMKTDTFDITKLIEDLTESEKLCLCSFILDIKEKRKEAIDKADAK